MQPRMESSVVFSAARRAGQEHALAVLDRQIDAVQDGRGGIAAPIGLVNALGMDGRGVGRAEFGWQTGDHDCSTIIGSTLRIRQYGSNDATRQIIKTNRQLPNDSPHGTTIGAWGVLYMY